MTPPQLATAQSILFCNVTARTRFGIPLYFYNTGIIYQIRNPRPVATIAAGDPYLFVAQRFARAQGLGNLSEALYYDSPKAEFYSSGMTMDWSYCDTQLPASQP
jgi:hypothetical protein